MNEFKIRPVSVSFLNHLNVNVNGKNIIVAIEDMNIRNFTNNVILDLLDLFIIR